MIVRCCGVRFDLPGYQCPVEAPSILVVAHRIVRSPPNPFYPAALFKERVIGWFHSRDLLFCSRTCYVNWFDADHYDHYAFCNACNYDKDCFICACDDGSCQPSDHQCNCSEGPGTVRHGAGWGYYRSKLVKRLESKNPASRSLPGLQSSVVSV